MVLLHCILMTQCAKNFNCFFFLSLKNWVKVDKMVLDTRQFFFACSFQILYKQMLIYCLEDWGSFLGFHLWWKINSNFRVTSQVHLYESHIVEYNQLYSLYTLHWLWSVVTLTMAFFYFHTSFHTFCYFATSNYYHFSLLLHCFSSIYSSTFQF